MRKFFTLTTKTFEDFDTSAVTMKQLWEKAAADGCDGLALICTLSLEKDAETKKFHAVFSSANEDRHGEIVYQNFDLKAFKKNPVFLDSHNYDSIEHIIGRIEPISVKNGALQGDVEFAFDNPKGLLAQKLAENGFLNTTSIGFIPKEFDDKGNILKSELLEVSAVSVPANAEALFEKNNEQENPEPAKPAEETPTPAPEPQADPKRAALNAVRDLQSEKQRHLRIIARELRKITDPSVRKRRVYQSIREVLRQDISVQ